MAWYECGEKLAAPFPISELALRRILQAVHSSSVDQSPEFLMLTVALIAAESGFNTVAASPSGAIGLMQLTYIGAREAANQCRLPLLLGEDFASPNTMLHNGRINVKYGTCLLQYYLDQVKGNRLLALVLYNGGYQQLTRFLNTGTLSKETSEYVLRVYSYLGRCNQ